ncbi:hypothetical protein JOQ06_008400 [Pogonophryne albipinna]|uniref:Uncharacterized protein n=1 Tax=Pogonophryne albipinna TaxID=1090488 RepID=A0AAD6FA05_9TELE|nr:hypothetical protein JOQ06_008400 [Pogonophryne albipinna]
MGFGGVGQSKKREGEAGSISDLHTDGGGGVRREEEKQEISAPHLEPDLGKRCQTDQGLALLEMEKERKKEIMIRPAHIAEPSEASQDLEVHVPEPLSGGPYFSKLMTR